MKCLHSPFLLRKRHQQNKLLLSVRSRKQEHFMSTFRVSAGEVVLKHAEGMTLLDNTLCNYLLPVLVVNNCCALIYTCSSCHILMATKHAQHETLHHQLR